jgi:hypothetical protein
VVVIVANMKSKFAIVIVEVALKINLKIKLGFNEFKI